MNIEIMNVLINTSIQIGQFILCTSVAPGIVGSLMTTIAVIDANKKNGNKFNFRGFINEYKNSYLINFIPFLNLAYIFSTMQKIGSEKRKIETEKNKRPLLYVTNAPISPKKTVFQAVAPVDLNNISLGDKKRGKTYYKS